MIDRDKLLSFAVPDGRQHVTERDHAFYALSIGFGQYPLDERPLRFVSLGSEVTPVPSVVLVLAHPGFWVADPRSGVDARQVVHADQSFAVSDTIPVAGIVDSRSRVTGLLDKGPGKAAIIFAETDLTSEGRPFARLNRAMLVRGGGGCGNFGIAPASVDLRFDDPPLDAIASQTRPEQALFYRLNGDLNPLHSDPASARAAGFDRPILHGLCTMGAIGRALLEAKAYDPSSLIGMRTRFVGPIVPGETLRTEIWGDGRFRTTVTERDCIVATGQAV